MKLTNDIIKGFSEQFDAISLCIPKIEKINPKGAEAQRLKEVDYAARFMYKFLKKKLPFDVIHSVFTAAVSNKKTDFKSAIVNGCNDLNERLELVLKIENADFSIKLKNTVNGILNTFAQDGLNENFIDALCETRIHPIPVNNEEEISFYVRENTSLLTSAITTNLRLLVEPYFNTDAYSQKRKEETVASLQSSIGKMLKKAGDDAQNIMKDALSSYVAICAKDAYRESMKHQVSLQYKI